MPQQILDCDEKIRRAKQWGKAHGYYGMLGGWIGREGRLAPVCQGWEKLYNFHHGSIEHWRTHRRGFSSGDPVWWYRSSCATSDGARLPARILDFTLRRVRIEAETEGQVKVVTFARISARQEEPPPGLVGMDDEEGEVCQVCGAPVSLNDPDLGLCEAHIDFHPHACSALNVGLEGEPR
jgi:hypothetical protein